MSEDILNFLNERYPVVLQKIEAVSDGMYRCYGNQGIYYARIGQYRIYEEQLEEVQWTNFLYEQGVGVSPAVPSVNGHVVETILPGDDLVVFYKAAPGSHLERTEWGASVLKSLGRQIGRMHRLTKEYEKSRPFKYVGDWHHQEEYQFDQYIPREETTIRERAHAVISEIKALPIEEATYGMIHGDLWLENIVVGPGQSVTMIDFQDCEKHYWVYDLAVPLYSALHYTFAGQGNISDYGKSIFASLIDGYLMEHAISDKTLQQIPVFLKLKEIFEYSLMHMYWDQRKLSEEQVRIMNLYRIRIEQGHPVIGW